MLTKKQVNDFSKKIFILIIVNTILLIISFLIASSLDNADIIYYIMLPAGVISSIFTLFDPAIKDSIRRANIHYTHRLYKKKFILPLIFLLCISITTFVLGITNNFNPIYMSIFMGSLVIFLMLIGFVILESSNKTIKSSPYISENRKEFLISFSTSEIIICFLILIILLLFIIFE